MALEMPLTNEKVKAEKLISPILSEVVHGYKTQLTLFSGEDLTVDSSKDLAGACDFFFALHPPKVEMEAPIVSLAEAKDEDMEWGVAQCAAQMYAAQVFNEQHNRSVALIFGCATTGVEWKFLKLQNNIFTIDRQSFTTIPEILGAWNKVIQHYLPVSTTL